MRNNIAPVFILLALSACSKHQEPLSCDSPSVQSAVLETQQTSGPIYYSRKLDKIKPEKKTDSMLSCKADLVLKSNLDNKRVLSLPVSYSVYSVDNKSQNSSSGINLSAEDKTKLNSWLTAMNASTKQLGDYQLTPGGALYVMKGDLQVLYFNGKAVTPAVSNEILNIEKSYTLGSNSVFIIGSYSGGTIDSDTLNNILIQIDKDGKYIMTRKFAYQQNGIMQNGESLVINGIIPFRAYAESTDFPIYVYSNGILTTRSDVKPDSYYENKFSTMSATDIVNIAKTDQCFDSGANEIDGSHACQYATKYCFMFKAIKESEDNQDYTMLQRVCNNN